MSRSDEVDETVGGLKLEWNEVELFSASQIISQRYVVTIYGSRRGVTRGVLRRMTAVQAIACLRCVGYNDSGHAPSRCEDAKAQRYIEMRRLRSWSLQDCSYATSSVTVGSAYYVVCTSTCMLAICSTAPMASGQ